MPLDLVLTYDYELFGDGSGDVFRHMVNPTQKLLDICERYNIKMTVFFEVIEYLKIKNEWDKGNTMGYSQNPAAAIHRQIQEVLRAGHDVQLHLHPQWIDAVYRNGWQVDIGRWRLTGSGDELPDSDRSTSVVRHGKSALEDILQPIDPQYHCRALRMGGFNIQPSGDILRAMRRSGLRLDSSVFPGGVADTLLDRYDYRDISEREPYWFVNGSDVLQISRNKYRRTVIECPVFALPSTSVFKYGFRRLRVKWQNRDYATNQARYKVPGKIFSWIRYLFTKEAVQWDYCLLGYRQLRKYHRRAERIRKESGRELHPFVLVGHSKDFMYPRAFEKFLEFTAAPGSRYRTMKWLLDQFQDEQMDDE
jgi:peptidoglycan/xylan/chitin deacetylase (PgdA/CDA1 family)